MKAIGATLDEAYDDTGRDPRLGLLWILPWGVALSLGAGLGAWVSHAPTVAAPEIFVAHKVDKPASRAGAPFGGLVDVGSFRAPDGAARDREALLRARLDAAAALAMPRPSPPAVARTTANPYGTLVDPGFFGAFALAPPDSKAIVQARLETAPAAPVAPAAPPRVGPTPPTRAIPPIAEFAPLPPARPVELGSAVEPERSAAQPEKAPAPDDRGVFAKLFGQPRQSNETVAYAEPETHVAPSGRTAELAGTDHGSFFSIFRRSSTPAALANYDKETAVYDISARVVYMPDGTRLEAHSGLGDYIDDPKHVNVRMRGATPPDVYDLSMREQLFHGVAALRLTPTGGEGAIFGRAGLLAHPFMLGPDGDSNGCVSFKDYDAFLKAFQDGKIKRLAVVASLS